MKPSKMPDIRGNPRLATYKRPGKADSHRKTMPKKIEKQIMQTMDFCKIIIEELRSATQVDQEKLHQPFDV
jgi:hypothetical protein